MSSEADSHPAARGASGFLRAFEPARRGTARHGARYSRFVSILKLALLLAAAGLIATVVFWAAKIGTGDGFQFSFARLGTGEEGELTMVNPRYTGADRHDRPFTVWADAASLDPDDRRVVHLDAVRADLALTATDWITLKANKGIFHQGRMSLHLSGDILVSTSEGYRFETASIYADLNSGFAIANKPVVAEGPIGTLSADRMKIFDHGNRVVLEGRVRVRINDVPKRSK